MATTQAQRAALFNTLTDLMGHDDAETLTEQLPPTGWDSMATKDDIKVLSAAFTAALADTNAKMAEGFAHATEERAKIIAAFTTALADIKTTMAEGFAHAAEERAKIIAAFTTALADTNAKMANAWADTNTTMANAWADTNTKMAEGFADINTKMAEGFAHATEERAKITATMARHMYVTVVTIVLAAVSIWVALFVTPV